MEFPENVTLGMTAALDPPIMNGAGCCKTVADVIEMSKSPAGGIVVGSYTKARREINPGNTFWYGEFASENSLGMPNDGEDYVEKNMPEMVRIAHDAGKKFIANVAEFTPEGYADMVELVLACGADAVEINAGCPNVVKGEGKRKPIVSFNLELIDEILTLVERRVGATRAIWWKSSPYSDPEMRERVARVIAFKNMLRELSRIEDAPEKRLLVKAVTNVNTYPNGYGVDTNGRPLIGVGFAGVSGPALKYPCMGQIKQMRPILPERISMIAVGGIQHGQDIADYIAVGAVAFQMTTELVKKGTLDATPMERAIGEFFDIVPIAA